MSFVDEYNPDIRELADTLFLGPQGELLEEVEQFNNRYQLNIGLTKKFNWKPGTYPKVNEHIQKILWLDKKANCLSRMVSRVEEADWRLRHFREQLETLEQKITAMRRDGVYWRDNSDDIVVILDALKNRITTQLEQVPENLGIDTQILYLQHEGDDVQSRRYDKIIIALEIKRPNLVIVNNGGTIGTIPYYGDISLRIHLNIMRFLNYWCGKDDWICGSLPSDARNLNWYNGRPNKSQPITLQAMNMFDIPGIEHPYISRRNHSYDDISSNYVINNFQDSAALWGSTNACLGEMMDPMLKAAWSFDLASLGVQFKLWATQYHIVRTGPLNNIRTSFHGNPKFLTPELTTSGVGAYESADACSLPSLTSQQRTNNGSRWSIGTDFAIDYCKEIECQLAESCNFFARHTDEDFHHRRDALMVEYLELCLQYPNSYPDDVYDIETLILWLERSIEDECLDPSESPTIWGLDYLTSEYWYMTKQVETLTSLADQLQGIVGFGEEKKRSLMISHGIDWFIETIDDYEVESETPFGNQEDAIKAKMIRWAARHGGIRT